MSNFHCHSNYSVRDSIAKVRDIFEKQKSLGKDYACISDHGSLAMMGEAFEVAKEMNMKLYAACEFYVKPSEEFDGKLNTIKVAELNKILKRKTATEEEKAKAKAELDKITSLKGYDSAYYHLTVLAYNLQGLLNLFKINNNGDFHYKTRVKLDDIKKYNGGLIVLSGCPAGELLRMIENGYYDRAENWLVGMKEVFGDRLYYELMYHDGVYQVPNNEIEISEIIHFEEEPTAEQLALENCYKLFENQDAFNKNVYEITYSNYELIDEDNYNDYKFVLKYKFNNTYLTKLRKDREREIYIKGIELARKCGVKIVASNDSHYVNPEDRKYWLITRMAMIGKDKDFTGNYHMLDDNSMFAKIYEGYVTEAELDESEHEIEQRLEVYDLPRSNYESTKEDESLFERIVWTGFKNKRLGTEYEEESLLKIPYELSVIQTKGFGKYFLKTREIVACARENGILVGPGRGSGAGGEVTYLSGITQVDPIKYGLMFERFLNPGRNAMPDIDVDLQSFACENFKPNQEYKDMFFTENEKLVSDEEINEYWKRYHELKVKYNDTRRDSVFKAIGKEYFEGFIGNQE